MCYLLLTHPKCSIMEPTTPSVTTESALRDLETNASALARLADAFTPKALFLLLAGVTYIAAAALSNWISQHEEGRNVH